MVTASENSAVPDANRGARAGPLKGFRMGCFMV
jgi:hypothetical protein